MAKITNKSGLTVGGNLAVTTGTKIITLTPDATLIAKDGVSWQALYSKMVELWTTAEYNEFPFPFYALDVLSGQYLMGTDGATYNGWKFDIADLDASRGYMRDGGWEEWTAGGVLARKYAGIISLGTVSSGSQLYYQTTLGGAVTNFLYTDAVNQGVQIYGDAVADPSTTTFDTYTYFKGYVREAKKKYKDSVLGDTGKTQTGSNIVNVLLANEVDLDVLTDTSDTGITNAPYSAINVKYFSATNPFTKDIDSAVTARNFGIVIDVGTHSAVDGVTNGTALITTAAGGITGADYTGGTVTVHEGAGKGVYTISGTPTATNIVTTTTISGTATGISFTLQRAVPIVATLQEIYTKIQYQLRQATDINGLTGGTSVIGKSASLLLNFVGPTLNAGFYAPTNPAGGGSGVTIMGYKAADVNSFISYDNTAATRAYPYASAGTLNCNANLTSGATGYYRMYITNSTVGDDDYGTATAITVNDASGNPIAGTITGSSIPFTFDYTGNTQGGRSTAVPMGVTVVAGNKGKAKPVVATGSIIESKAISISLVAETDRAYLA
jgi:hypothetical protein